MAHHLLHGTLDVTILEADHLTNPTRASGAAPSIFRRVRKHFTTAFTFTRRSRSNASMENSLPSCPKLKSNLSLYLVTPHSSVGLLASVVERNDFCDELCSASAASLLCFVGIQESRVLSGACRSWRGSRTRSGSARARRSCTRRWTSARRASAGRGSSPATR
jgi:hypothetical protein